MSWDLRLGDCLDPVAGLASLGDKSVDHVICDPPYEAEAHTLQRRSKTKRVNGEYGKCYSAPLDFAAIDPDTRAAACAQFGRICRRWVIVFCQAEAVAAWRDALNDSGLMYKRPCIWVKPDGQPQFTGDRPAMGYESIVAAHAPGASQWNGGGKAGVYVVLRNHLANQPFQHPTQKPLALMEALIRDFTDPGDLICDPFAGSGTTGVACIRLGRRFIGWERDPKYHAVAMRRLSGAREQLRMFDGVAAGTTRSAPALPPAPTPPGPVVSTTRPEGQGAQLLPPSAPVSTLPGTPEAPQERGGRAVAPTFEGIPKPSGEPEGALAMSSPGDDPCKGERATLSPGEARGAPSFLSASRTQSQPSRRRIVTVVMPDGTEAG